MSKSEALIKHPRGRAATARLLLNLEPIFQPHFVGIFFIGASTAVRDHVTLISCDIQPVNIPLLLPGQPVASRQQQ